MCGSWGYVEGMAAKEPELHYSERRGFYTYRKGTEVYLGRHEGRARRELRKIQASRSLPGESRPATVSEAVQRWLGQAAGDADWHEDMCAIWQTIAGKLPLAGVPLTHYSDVVRRLKGKRSAQTIAHVLSHVGQVLRFCQQNGWINHVPLPLRRGEKPKVQANPKDVPAATLAEVFADLDALPRTRRTAAICRFILYVGCRPEEACQLTWEQVDLAAGTCRLTEHKTSESTGSDKTVYLTPQAKEIIEAQKGRTGFVFRNSLGRPFTPGGLRSVLRRRGLTGAYQLRHTFAQNALDQTGIENVAKLLGHVDLRMVQRYARVKDAKARAVAQSLSPALPVAPAPRTTDRASAARASRRGTRQRSRRKPSTGTAG